MATAKFGGDPLPLHPLSLTVTDTQGKIIASAGPQPLPVGTSILPQLSPQSRANLNAVLNDPHGKTSESAQEANNTLVAIAPMVESSGHVQAALVLKVDQPHTQILLSYFFYIIFFGGTAAFIFTTLIGTVFGYLIARGLTRRLKKLSVAANRWSRGDFSALAVDRSQDELGQMARDLNHMAEQLHNLLETRQQLATLEERNRLARDLQERMKALGGDLKLESAPDQGTLVVAHCTRLGTDSSEKAGMQGATTL